MITEIALIDCVRAGLARVGHGLRLLSATAAATAVVVELRWVPVALLVAESELELFELLNVCDSLISYYSDL